MTQGNLWSRMNSERRRTVRGLAKVDFPTVPGVYAWYRDGEPVYSGRAIGEAGVQGRIWGNHLKTGADLSRSSFRRNVCEHLGIAPTSKTRIRPTVMTPADVSPVNSWIRECSLAWIEFGLKTEAAEFEKALHAEWLPPLSRR